jgi:hypothetical protein
MCSRPSVGLSHEDRSTWRTALDVLRGPHPGSQTQDTSNNVDDGHIQSQSLPKLEVRESPGKGLGLFTLEWIPAYSRVLDDDALVSLAQGEDLPQLWDKYLTLPEDLRKSFDTLSYPKQATSKEDNLTEKLTKRGYTTQEASSMARVSSRFQANAFRTGDSSSATATDARWSYALFPTVARINHQCTPNCHAHYCTYTGAQVVYTLREIEANEELTISYFDMTMSIANRQVRANSWGFTCTCPACFNDAPLFKDYEAGLTIIRDALAAESRLIYQHGNQVHTIQKALAAIEVASREDHPWLVAALPRLYHLRSLLLEEAQRQHAVSLPAGALNLPEESSLWCLQKALDWECRITGLSSPMSCERRAAVHRAERSLTKQEGDAG